MQLSDIPDFFPKPFGANAGASFIRDIPAASQIGAEDGAASLTDGFPPLTFQPIASGGVPPFGQDMNGILFQTSAWCRWVAAGAQAQFNSTFATAIGGYPKYSVLASTTPGLFWQSTVENNATNPDSGGAANWIAVTPAAADAAAVVAGASTSLYVTPAAIAAAIGDGTDQSVRLPGGRIIKDGTFAATVVVGGAYTVVFDTPFPTACRTAVPVPLNLSSSSARDSWVQLISKNAGGFRFLVQADGQGGANTLDGVDWIATGY